ncbi:MAG: HD domain-containing protein [Candidatus Firestonebacteria bacterium]|nr:HD domain-containing protein [Candidatus Firestonebacteria bacterium]
MQINTSRTLSELIASLSLAMDMEEGKKLYHSWRIAIIATNMALKRIPERTTDIFYASLLHDVGCIGLPRHLIHYPTIEEQKANPIIFAHPLVGAEVVSSMGLPLATRLILEHHEWWNGHGYPRGKQGDEIDIGAQIIRASDTLEFLLNSPSITDGALLLDNLKKRVKIEYSSKILELLLEVIQKEDVYKSISDLNKIPNLFAETKKTISNLNGETEKDIIGSILEIFAQFIDTTHPYTIGHSKRVSRYALLIAIAMNVPHDEITMIKWGGLLHDIGLLCISRNISGKTTIMDKREFDEIKKHPVYTMEILSGITDMAPLIPIASGHHENFDGSGYPKGLKGEEIPLGARIMAIANAYDAMTSARPYRDSSDIDKACTEIKNMAGKQFDPKVVNEALPVLRSMGLLIIHPPILGHYVKDKWHVM